MHPGACDLRKTAEDFLFKGERNTIAESEAMSKEYAGMPIFRTPVLVGISAASDPLYPRLRDKSVIGNFHCLPSDWVSGAESVISVFLPFSNEVCTDNSKDISTFSYGWMHARNEGQTLLNAVGVRVPELRVGVVDAQLFEKRQSVPVAVGVREVFCGYGMEGK